VHDDHYVLVGPSKFMLVFCSYDYSLTRVL
jgi:hypothetical protein